jgi:hypothetical protein
VVRKQGSWVFACLALASLTTACGGESTKDADGAAGERSGGTGGTGSGSGGTGTGGTGNLRPASVGLSLTLERPNPTEVDAGSRSCHAGTSSGFTYVIGVPTPSGTIVSGTAGLEFECVVEPDGAFSASGNGMDENGKKPISFSFTGRVKDKLTPVNNVGGMGFYSPDTAFLTTLDGFPGCEFGPVSTYKEGAILTDVACPMIVSSDDTTSGCSVRGVILFEHCQSSSNGNP